MKLFLPPITLCFLFCVSAQSLSQLFSSEQPPNSIFSEQPSSRQIFNIAPGRDKSTPEMIKYYGYPAESHKVTTEDGYILTMHRIPHGKNEFGKIRSRPRPVVYLMHGLLSSSYEWVFNSRDKLLSLQLADAGYDVFMGNSRGNTYSRKHSRMTVKDRAYWDFSMNEIGKYDLPASIDLALKLTNQTKLFYIGFSMGTSDFFVMSSLRPEYNSKIRLMTALAPVVYLANHAGPTRIISPLEPILSPVLGLLFNGEFVPPYLITLIQRLGSLVCSNPFFAEYVCATVLYIGVGWSYPQSHNSSYIFSNVISHFITPTSTRTVAHIAQLTYSGEFKPFDFGAAKNKLVYGRTKPEPYSLRSITAPVALIYGHNDGLVSPHDVQRLASELPNVVWNRPVNHTFWNHVDYHIAKDVNGLLNYHILNLMSRF